MVPGSVRRLSERFGDGSNRCDVGLGPGVPGRQLEQQRQELAADLDRLGEATEAEFAEMKMTLVEGFNSIGDALGNLRVPTDIDVDVDTVPADDM